MLSRALKEEIVKEFGERFRADPFLFIVEYKGLTVKEMERLRAKLKRTRADFKVVKNTLLRIASQGTEVEKIKHLFEGPTAVTICNEDPVSVAKVFAESVKELPVLKLKGGIVEGRVVDFDGMIRLSRLPSKQVLFSQLLGLLSSPLGNFMGTLTELQRRLLYALNSVKELKEKEEPKQ